MGMTRLHLERPDAPFFHNPARACKDADTDIFYSDRPADRAAALRLCGSCPVRQECADWAEATHEPEGIWGGRSRSRHAHKQRQRRERRAAA